MISNKYKYGVIVFFTMETIQRELADRYGETLENSSFRDKIFSNLTLRILEVPEADWSLMKVTIFSDHFRDILYIKVVSPTERPKFYPIPEGAEYPRIDGGYLLQQKGLQR